MSEQKFQEAKSNLAFSQNILDRMRQQQQMEQQMPMMPQQGGEMMMEEPMQEKVAEETRVAEETESKGIIQGVVDAIKPMFDKLMKKEDDEKKVEIKIDGTMEPKEESKEIGEKED